MSNVIVTGGSRGLGLAIARVLASAGHRVIAIARSESEPLTAAIKQVDEAGGGSLHFRSFDLADVVNVPNLVKGIKRDFGPIYGLINNAGIGTNGILATMHNAQIERLVRLNLVSPIILTKYVVRAMMVGGAGRIINIASIAAFTGYSGLAVYGATKASIVGFTRSLAREVGPLGITVNAVAPGFVDTAMTEGVQGGSRRQIVRRSALLRLAEASDIANAVEFLLSDKARNITGTVVTVDAGSTA